MGTLARMGIAIPTYNRADLLNLLLDSIARDFSDSEWPTDLDIVILDNASTDNTIEIVNTHIRKGMPIRLICNASNLGMDANLAACFEATNATYLWQLGDDEVLYKGAARWVLDFCRQHDFGLLHLECTGFRKGGQSAQWARSIPEKILVHPLNSKRIFRQANVFLTFISSNIINRQLVLQEIANFNPHAEVNTFLPQMNWVYGALKASDSHFIVKTPIFGALSGNSGGYRLIEVFGSNLLEITRRQLKPTFPEADSIMANAVLSRLIPNEIFSIQRAEGDHNHFESEKIRQALAIAFGSKPYMMLFVLPLLSHRKWIRRCSFTINRVFNLINRKILYALL